MPRIPEAHGETRNAETWRIGGPVAAISLEETLVAIVSQDAVHKPEHPEGRAWVVAWVTEDGGAIFADSLSDIVGEIIPGYNDLDDDHRDDLHLQARLDLLAPLAARAQAVVLTELAYQNVHLSEAELNAALRDKELAAGISRWNPAEPLILMTTAYEPYTDEPRPEGSILWIDPTNEAAFLSSLNKLGEGELWVTGG